MAYLNEVTPAEVSGWLDNFNTCPNNIFGQFQVTPINFFLSAYDALCANDFNHINIYFGMDDNDNPKIIAVGSYTLDAFDGKETTGFADILESNKIFELYSNTKISLSLAREYTTNWKTNNESSSLFLSSVLLPRPNFIKLFKEDKADPVEIFFGMNSSYELKVMEKDPSEGTGAIVFNTQYPSPPFYPSNGLIISNI